MSQENKPSTTTFTYHDPSKNFDGTPYEAAGKAIAQTGNVVRLLQRSLKDTMVQVRNAYMQRNIDLGDDPKAADWSGSGEQKLLAALMTVTERFLSKLAALHKSATFDPSDPETRSKP